jgi:hypothetical protein
MAQVQGVFWGESRIFGYPMFDLNGVAPFTQVTPTPNGSPLQLTSEGEWLVMGHSLVQCTSAAGGLANNTPVNLQVIRQDNGEQLVRLGPQPTQAANLLVPMGAPIEHICGKAGNPGYLSYHWPVPSGTRLLPQIVHQAAATPTGRSPFYMVAHALLDRGKDTAPIEIGSKEEQQNKYFGKWAAFTGRLNYSAANPLAINQGDTLIIPINTTQYFFVSNLLCRAIELGSPNIMLPNDALNPLVQEDEILVSLKDTSNQSPFTTPGFVPLWSAFGNLMARDYHPPTMFVIRPRGSLEIDIQNGPTAAVQYALEFTIEGILVDKPSDAIMEQLA